MNPKEIAVSKTNNWKTDAKAGQSNPTPQFGGGGLKTMTVDLLFDEKIGDGKKVKEVCEQLFQAMEATITSCGGAGDHRRHGSRPRPARWRRQQDDHPATADHVLLGRPDDAVRRQLQAAQRQVPAVQLRAGEPTRAQATLQLEQATPSTAAGQGQNPTTRGMAGLGAHQVA